MPTPMRQALGNALLLRLAGVLPGATPRRGVRGAVSELRRPALLVDVAEDAQADEEQSPGECLWTLEATVTALLQPPPATGTPAAQDVAAEDAAAAAEGALLAALQGQPLVAPGGGDLCSGLRILASRAAVPPAEDAARRLPEAAVTVAAEFFLPTGQASFPS